MANTPITDDGPWEPDENSQKSDLSGSLSSQAQDSFTRLKQSEIIYRAIFDSIDQGFVLAKVIFDQDGNPTNVSYLETNQVFSQQLGLADKTLSDVIPSADPKWLNFYAQVVRTGQPARTEYYVEQIERWFTVFASRLGEEGSHQIAIVFDDITYRKQAQEALRQSEERQAFLLKLIDALRPLADPIEIQALAVKLLGEHLGVNQAHYGEIIGTDVVFQRGYGDGLPPMEGRFRTVNFSERILKGYQAGQVQVCYDTSADDSISEAGKKVLISAPIGAYVSVPVVKEGEWVATLGVHTLQPRNWGQNEIELVQETAERIWSSVERAKVEENLQEANRRKDEFIAMLGHELRNPLASLANTLLVLKLTGGDDDTLRYPKAVEQMSQQVDHMTRMVDDLLDVGRIRYGLIHLHKKPVDLRAIVQQTVSVARPFYKEQDRQLTVTLPPFSLYMVGDETRLSQVLMNLLTNGLKYTQPTGHVWVSLELAENMPDNKQALLRVKDDGFGISSDQLNTLFDIFVQREATLGRLQGGLGLGLALVKQLVTLHEGSIDVYSAGPSQGSEFLIRLPLTMEIPKKDSPGQGKYSTEEVKGKVLVVDDNQTIADVTARLVELLGYQTRVSYSGADAIVVAEHWRPDIILLDLGMPHMDGFEVNNQLRDQQWGQSFSIIALTGYGQESLKARTHQAGFAAYLLKPLNLPLLRNLLAQIMSDKNTPS